MKVYLSADGSILLTTPSVIGRGSTVIDFEVDAPFSAAIVTVRFGLRSGTTEPLVLTRRAFVSNGNRNLWSNKIPYTVSQYSGSVPYTIELLDGDGRTIATPQGSLTVSPGTVPTVPDDPPGDAWTKIQEYLNDILAEAEDVSSDLGEDLDELAEKVEEHSNQIDTLGQDLQDLSQSVEDVIAKAEAGEFDGFSPIVEVTPGTLEDTVVITDKEGEKSFSVPKDASKIIFPAAVKTAYPVGNITLENGIGIMANAGESVADLFRNVWFKVMQPTVTQPSLSVSFSGAAKEVGTTIHPAYYATFNAGSYSFGPDTGVSVTEWRTSDTEGNSSSDSMSTVDVLLTDETSYQLTVECDHTAGAVPLDNEGNAATVAGIAAGTITWTSAIVKGYRNSFYGAFTQDDLDTLSGLTESQLIRTLTASGKALQNGSSFTVVIPAGTVQVVFAYPATLRDVSSVKDVNGMGAEIKSSFVLQTADVEGYGGYTAIPYKVYVLEYAEAVETANTYTVTI